MGSTGGRVGAQLSEYVKSGPIRSPYSHNSPVKVADAARRGRFLGGRRKKAILGTPLGGSRAKPPQPLHWSTARDPFEFRPLRCRQRAGRLSGGSNDPSCRATDECPAIQRDQRL